MAVVNPAPAQLAASEWSVAGGAATLIVNIPTKPSDNDLDGVVILGKVGSDQTLAYPTDVFYKGAWAEFITIDTDASNVKLGSETTYTLAVIPYDQFGVDATIVSATKNATTGVVEVVKTGSSGKRTEINPSSDGETHFYGDRGDTTVEELATIGINSQGGDFVVLNIGSANMSHIGIYTVTNSAIYSGYFACGNSNGTTLHATNNGGGLAGGFQSTTGANEVSVDIAGQVYGINTSASGTTGIAARFKTTSGSFASTNTVEIVENRSLSTGNALYIDVSGSSSTAKAIKVNSGNSDLSGGVVYFKSYTVATLPSAATAGGMIYVSDETGGAVMAFSDGTNWRRCTDRAVVA